MEDAGLRDDADKRNAAATEDRAQENITAAAIEELGTRGQEDAATERPTPEKLYAVEESQETMELRENRKH